MTPSLKITVGVGGRFHSDHMMDSFLRAGHDARLFTTLPRSRFTRIPAERITSFIFPEIVHRIGKTIHLENKADLIKMGITGRRMAQFLRMSTDPIDALFVWSSFGLESLLLSNVRKRVLIRDSVHIVEQMALLQKEFEARRVSFPDRGPCIERELQEYDLADFIQVCSNYVRDSFIKRGFPPTKLFTQPLGVDTSLFIRKTRYSVHPPIQIVYFGNLSIYKGVYYLLEATKPFSSKEINLHLVGSISEDFAPILKKYNHFEWHPPMPHQKLAEFLQSMDIFVMPSLQDGYGLVIPQAMATGLCTIVTDQCGGKELIVPNETGFIVPSGTHEPLQTLVGALLKQPEQIATIGRNAARSSHTNTWNEYSERINKWIDGIF